MVIGEFFKTYFMKTLMLLSSFLVLQLCIPVSVAPRIVTDKIVKAKRFKRKLPKQYSFIFRDPKEADEFYSYVNTKHILNSKDVECNVSFSIDKDTFYFSFHEVEKKDVTLNLIPFLFRDTLEEEGLDAFLGDDYETRDNFGI
jgi:hypothetical protein